MQPLENYFGPLIWYDMIWYDMTILMCAQKLTDASLIYGTEQKLKPEKWEKLVYSYRIGQ